MSKDEGGALQGPSLTRVVLMGQDETGALTPLKLTQGGLTTNPAVPTGILQPQYGGTGIANNGTLTNATATTITGGGTLALGVALALRGRDRTTSEFLVQDATPATRNDGTALVADDCWLETDTNIRWLWNGTYWLSEQLFSEGVSVDAQAAGRTDYFQMEPFQDVQYNIFVVSVTSALYVATTNSATDYWLIILNRLSAAAAATQVGTINTSAIAADTFAPISAAVGTHLDVSALNTKAFSLAMSRNNAPGALYGQVKFNYRLAHL